MDVGGLVGKRIDHYTIVRHIARGGMAVVYLAYEEGLDRQVALKVLLPAYAEQSEFKSRFVREAQAAAKLKHPNIVRIYYTGLTPAGEPYFAMEYCSRGTLEGWLETMNRKSTILPPGQSLSIVRYIADGLRVAHQAGIVHRDLKPSNILIHENGSPVLADLGIAAITTAASLTRTGTLLGTPQYMSPEQASGNQVDGRSDIYSLGIILYELLAGRRPFDEEETLAVLHKQLYEQPIPLRRVRTGLSPKTYQVVEKCLHKQPERRFQSAAELVAVLDKALAAEGRSGSRRILIKSDQDQSKRLSWLTAMTGPIRVAVALAIAGILIVSGWALVGHERSGDEEANSVIEFTQPVSETVGTGASALKWAVVMTESDEDHQQWIHRQPLFPRERIQSLWADGSDITSLAYVDGDWAVVMTESDDDLHQLVDLQKVFPQELVKAHWAEGFDVTGLAYGDGEWAVVMTESDDNVRQWILRQETFPRKLIENHWAQGSDITSLAYGDGKWAVVMTESDEDRKQLILRQKVFPRELITAQWANGFDITSLVYDNDNWVVVMTENGEEQQQWILRQNEFPRELIKAKWAEGSDIAALAFGHDGL